MPRTTLAIVTSIAASALLLSACGGSAGSAPPPTKEVGKNDINPTPRDKVKDGGTLQWGVDTYPANFNWLEVDATDGDIPAIVQSFMPTPAVSDASGTWSPDPDYVTSAKLVSSDPQKVEYKLNPKAKWSDGTPITWEDYKSQWQSLNGKNPAFLVQGSAGYSSISDISRGADDFGFTVTYSPKLAEWANLFAILYPKSMTSTPAEFNSGWKDGPKVTGGPFKIGKLDQTGKNVTVVRDPSWWGNKPKLDQIVFKYYSSAQVEVDGLASGAFDFASVAADIDAYKRTSTMQGVSERRANLPNYRAVVFNGAGNSILADAKLRTAIIRGIDRAPIAKAEIGQLIPDAQPDNNHIYMVGSAAYQDNAAGYGYDQAAANSALDALGWKLQGKVRVKDGKPLKIRDVIPAGTKAAIDESKLIQQQLAAIGVDVEIQQYDRSSFFEQHITPGDFDIAQYAQMWDFAPPVNIAETYFAVGAQEQSNPGRIGSDKVNDLLNQAAAELDLTKRQQLMNEVDKELWALGHSLPLYQRPSIVATRSTLANMGNTGLASFLYADMGWTQ